MRFPRFRFSIRTLLIAVTVFGAILGLSIRFGPHVVWKMSNRSAGVVPIPSQPLVAAAPDELLVRCQVGPLSFELPEEMSRHIAMSGGNSRYLRFQADGRTILVQLPELYDQSFYVQDIANFPDKAKLTFPRRYQEIHAAQSSDFSWGMSRRELQWHQWLLSERSQIHRFTSIDYLWRPDLDGILLSFPSPRPIFLWATVDCQWEGMIQFQGTTPDDLDWIRHLCTTFAINGDPEIFKGSDEAEIKALINITELDPK